MSPTSFLYDVHGVRIESVFPLGPKNAEPGREPLISILASDDEWQSDRPETDEEWMSLKAGPDGFTLWFEDLGKFEIDLSGRSVRAHFKPGTPRDTQSHLILDHVIPRAIARTGKLVLHASAVSVDEGAILFLGESGAGKSTMAAAFGLAGHAVLSDDGVHMEPRDGGFVGYPSYEGMRLWPAHAATLFPTSEQGSPVAHYTTKVRANSSVRFDEHPQRILRCYYLPKHESSVGIAVSKLSSVEEIVVLTEHRFRLDASTREDVEAELDGNAASSLRPLLRKLTYPHDLTYLPDVLAAIRADLSEQHTDE